MGIVGWVSGAIYLLLSIQALYALKGGLWVLVSLAGPIAFFPVWASLLFGFNDPIIWSLFIVCIIDALLAKRKIDKKENELLQENIKIEESKKELSEKKELEKRIAALEQEKENERIKKKKDNEKLKRQNEDKKLIASSPELQMLENKVKELEALLSERKQTLNDIEKENKKKEELRKRIKELEDEGLNYD